MAISFHRRIYPWIVLTMFLALAPAVLFYTSGYRWNMKKGKIERNGTLILASTPTGSLIFIDGRPTGEKTPINLQNIAPGLHRIRVTKEGYFSWEKTLDIRPERVTFASDIWLWKQNEPQLVAKLAAEDVRLATPATRTHPSQNGSWMLQETSTSTRLLSAAEERNPFVLPRAVWRWSNGNLVGVASGTLLTVVLPATQPTIQLLPRGTIDREENVELQKTNEGELALVLRTDQKTGFLLPHGNWKIWSVDRQRVFLRDETRWLSARVRNRILETHEATGDTLRPYRTFRELRELLVENGELWNWAPEQDPELLLRQSNPIINAAWHHKGNDVFFATATDVFALNLDPRDGRRLTHLASFDRITDLSIVDTAIEIKGIFQGKRGVWKLDVEL